MNFICKIKNLNKSFSGDVVLSDINLDIYKGDMIAITGKSGSGKSTFLNIIGLLEKPTSGEINLFGKNIVRASKTVRNELLREKITYLFQSYALIENETIGQNLDVSLIYSKADKREKKLLKEEALNKVGVEYPLNTKIYSLSGGEQQRVALARILLRPSEIILADEPTGSLDPKTKADILDLLVKLNNVGKTIIIVTHDEYLTSKCTRKFKLIHGNLEICS
ncbi:putative bacteriocin export ABC transporter [Metaclostridioides mangenotii]|uniref:putative bacteriocin export ABC transporter n=1 Tax=Metaclostridioides mangenotii TaxID=1540 RepID=UPI0004804EB0|nr:putative bacteriocin export ABC transporter [Clostridioides mangenotii]